MEQKKTIYIKGKDIESLKDLITENFMFDGDHAVTICHTENKDEFVIYYPDYMTSSEFANDFATLICVPNEGCVIEGWFENDGSIYGIPLGRKIMMKGYLVPEDEEYEEILLVDSQNQCYIDVYATEEDIDDVKLTKDEEKYSESSLSSFIARPTSIVSATFHSFKAPCITHEEAFVIQDAYSSSEEENDDKEHYLKSETNCKEKQHKGLLGFLCGLFK